MTSNFIYWKWDSFFNEKKIKEINSFIDKNFDGYQDPKNSARDLQNKNKKIATVKHIYYKKIKHLLYDLEQEFMYQANTSFGYDLFGLKDIEKLNFNIYSSNDFGSYGWHTDGSRSDLYDVKLTVLINLSIKKYEGGQFFIFDTNELEVKELNSPGSVIMFRSFYNHKVMPVTKGERRTLAIFLKGPKFK
jgi:PKHD-type hydroxylase